MRPFNRTYFWIVPLLVAIGSAFMPLDAAARNADRRLQSEIARTQEIIDRAEEIVDEALGPLPRRLVDEAQARQREARGLAFDGSPTLREQERALATSLEARRLALRAIEITKAQRRLLERVRQLIAENQELVTRAREAVAPSKNAEAERFLDAGLDQLERGQRAFHNGEFRQAVRFTLLGRDLILRSVRTAEGEPAVDRARVQEDLERTDRFLEEANSFVDDDRAARVRYEEAERLQEQARRHLRADRLREARQLTLRARDAALDVFRAGREVPEREGAEAAILRVDERLGEIGPPLRERGDPQVLRLLDQVRKHLEMAREALADGVVTKALAEAQLAASLLGQAEDAQP